MYLRLAAYPAMLALCLTALIAQAPASAAQEAKGALKIEGRAAQALHCSAMLFMVGGVMYDAGLIARVIRDDAQRAALIMLEHVPGSEAQRIRAMTQRFHRIMDSRSPQDLVEEYQRSDNWCRREFLPRQ